MTHRTQRAIASIAALTFLLNPLVVYAQIITFNDPNVVIPTLLNPIEYGIHASAQEIPSLRTLSSATFQLSEKKRTLVTVPQNVFTVHPQNSNLIVLASEKGIVQNEQFVFDYLPQGTRVSFDLNNPSYTLKKGGDYLTFTFATSDNVSGEILNDHQIAYQLSPTARLIWTVKGQSVQKEIVVNQHNHNSDNKYFAFSLESNLTSIIKNQGIALQNAAGKTMIHLNAPELLSIDHQPLLTPIALVKENNGQMMYEYDESSLPESYIIDPTAGPQNSSSADFGGYNDSETCQGTSCLASTTPVIDASATLHASFSSFGLSPSVLVEDVAVSISARAETSSGTCHTNVSNTLLSNNPAGPFDSITVATTNLCGESNTTVTGNQEPSASFHTTDFNDNGLALDITFTSTNSDAGDVITVNSVSMTLTYSEAASCTLPTDCSAGRRACISGTCAECTSDAQCGLQGCDEATGRCNDTYNGVSCGSNTDCSSNLCNGGVCATPNGIICALDNASLPSGVTIDSFGTSINFTDIGRNQMPITFRKSGIKIVDLNLINDPNASECLLDFVANANPSTYSSVFYPSDIPDANTDDKYSFYVKKSASHNRLRFCAGKSSLGCTSSDSWSFLASANGTIVATNGGFDASNIHVEVGNGYWQISNAPGGSAQGEVTTSGGAACNITADCTDNKACIAGQCAACTTNGQCPSGTCTSGQCTGAALAGSCAANNQCISNHCFNGKCTAGNECSYTGNSLPSGITMHLKSNNNSITFDELPENTPTDVYFAKSGIKFSEITLTQISGASPCLVDLNANLNASSYTAIFHAPDAPLGTAGNTYTMYVPKSASHDQIRVCSGKTSIGCTSADSWSFIANSAGSIVSTNGGFDTTGITVSVSGGFWVVTGLTGTSLEGETNGGGGGGGAPADVPEFSTYGLLILIGGCYLMLRQNNAIGA